MEKHSREYYDDALGDPVPPTSLKDIESELTELRYAIMHNAELLSKINGSVVGVFVMLIFIAALLYRQVYGAWF